MTENHMEELYNSKNRLVSFVHNNRLDNIVKSVFSRNKRILDAGCGEGHLLQRLHNFKDNEYYGIDVTPIAIEHAKLRCPFAKIKTGNLLETGYDDNFFDVVICTEVLEHIPQFKLVLREFKRIVKPGGLLIISFPNEILWTISRFFLGRKPIKVPDHFNSFRPSKMKEFVGMKVISKFGLPFRLPFFCSLGYQMVFKNNKNGN